MRGQSPQFVTRFAPSPTGPLHLGHAFSALTAFDMANAAGGDFLLRIEDIDQTRSRDEYEAAIYADLDWLGIGWTGSVLRQSERLPDYTAALDRLTKMGVTYPCTCTRRDIAAAIAAPQDGAPSVYPGTCRHRTEALDDAAFRLDMARAIEMLGGTASVADLTFTETGQEARGTHTLDPAGLVHDIGDVVLGRRDTGVAYHLAVVIDDAAQGITHVVRGADLLASTPLHRLLQALLTLPVPVWHHHRLIRDAAGKRLAKRDNARALATYRATGVSPENLRSKLGLRLQ